MARPGYDPHIRTGYAIYVHDMVSTFVYVEPYERGDFLDVCFHFLVLVRRLLFLSITGFRKVHA